MQFLLDENEYAELCDAPGLVQKSNQVTIQRLCILVANFKPIERDWDKENSSPWGCILNEINNPGYCDACPVSDECPHKGKNWSK